MLDPIHPFPARMAPEIAFDFFEELKPQSLVLDPMCGSGVSLRSALLKNHRAVGVDADPLAVLMSKVWTDNHQHKKLCDYAEKILRHAKARKDISVPWHDEAETTPFVEYWFAKKQRIDLAKLAMAIWQSRSIPEYVREAMSLALSRLIITKTKGASLAWDVSHSRPHIKKENNDFDVMSEFLRSCEALTKKLSDNEGDWSSSVTRGDARKLRFADGSVDAVISSPPYMNAIDYMRGHRLSLVWLGYSLATLRAVRSRSIGAEVARDVRAERRLPTKKQWDPKIEKILDQYLHDIGALMREIKRVSKKRAKICIITANSNLRGHRVPTNKLVQAAAAGAGLTLISETIRPIQKSSRYLPVKTGDRALKLRMMEEHIQHFVA